jgi:predicted nucleotidyltransferase
MVKKNSKKNSVKGIKVPKKESVKETPKGITTLQLKDEHEIAMDFAVKVYQKFENIVKSIVLFGSTVKQTMSSGSDIDIIIVIDDVSVNWETEVVNWYREELDKILQKNPYSKALHINTVKLSTWWEDLMKGDPVIINILRHGEAMIDLAGFFEPLKHLLIRGKIKATPEAIYTCLQRAPEHIRRSKNSELASIDGLYWAMVDASHAALIAEKVLPPSPEHIPLDLQETFVDSGRLKPKYVSWYKDILMLHKKISHGEITDLKGVEIDDWQQKAEEFLSVMVQLVKESVE